MGVALKNPAIDRNTRERGDRMCECNICVRQRKAELYIINLRGFNGFHDIADFIEETLDELIHAEFE